MNKTTITLKGNVVTLLFGTWVVGELIDRGFELDKIQDNITKNPFKFIPLLVYLAAVNATAEKDLEKYNLNDFYDWIDEVKGFGSKEVVKVLKCFTTSITYGVKKKPEAVITEEKAL